MKTSGLLNSSESDHDSSGSEWSPSSESTSKLEKIISKTALSNKKNVVQLSVPTAKVSNNAVQLLQNEASCSGKIKQTTVTKTEDSKLTASSSNAIKMCSRNKNILQNIKLPRSTSKSKNTSRKPSDLSVKATADDGITKKYTNPVTIKVQRNQVSSQVKPLSKPKSQPKTIIKTANNTPNLKPPTEVLTPKELSTPTKNKSDENSLTSKCKNPVTIKVQRNQVSSQVTPLSKPKSQPKTIIKTAINTPNLKPPTEVLTPKEPPTPTKNKYDENSPTSRTQEHREQNFTDPTLNSENGLVGGSKGFIYPLPEQKLVNFVNTGLEDKTSQLKFKRNCLETENKSACDSKNNIDQDKDNTDIVAIPYQVEIDTLSSSRDKSISNAQSESIMENSMDTTISCTENIPPNDDDFVHEDVTANIESEYIEFKPIEHLESDLNMIINPETGILELSSANCEGDRNLSLKRKLINPEIGALEDDNEYVPKKIEQTIKRKCKLLNPTTGILEEIEDETETSEEKSNGKKKRRTPKLWARKKAQEERLKDHTRRNIPNCRCKCRNKISEQEAEKIFQKFINLDTHTEQNIYLQGCVKEEVPKRFRPRQKGSRPRRCFLYTLKLKKKDITVCCSAFLAVHDIKRDRLKKKVLQKHKDIADGRGKHDNHPRRVPQESIEKIHSFISGLPVQASHYSRTDNKHRKYLSADLNIAELHRQFLTINPDLKDVVKYEKFRDVFNLDFNISFGSPRKDICNVCEKFKVDIKSAELAQKTEELERLKGERELHHKKAETFFNKLTEASKDTDDHTLAICFDYQKNLPLPVTNAQDEFYRRQLWLHNFGVHNIKEGTATMYLYTENYALKGPNEVITALEDYIECNKKPEHTHLKIFCDNCFSQNKNRYLYAFLDQLCSQWVVCLRM
ncbi:hypothetical protein O0L34_g11347 [Tuta absoluta]|nr:hypothetical protein O0L34_g11347 [Tuta absoluta]